MSASISSKKSNVGMAFLKRAAGIVTNATGEYITEAMPVTSSTISEAKSTINEVTSKLSNTTQSVFPKLKQLKSQTSFRSIGTWFLHKEDEFDIEDGFDATLTFDNEVDSAEIAESSITEFDRSASKISKSVVQSSHQMVEAQIVSTANIVSSMDKQTAVISAGFDKTTAVLNKILEVMTKNTATLIEATVASNASQSANDKMLSSGKFNMSDYKKIVGQNFQNSELGMLSIIPSMMSGGMWKQLATPEAILGGLIKGGINKAAPNLKANMKTLDESINNVIMTSLIRLGESRKFGPGGTMAKLFGINADRRDVDTSRSTLNLKPVPYDSISREALTNALPGYMRQILIQLGGPDMTYDYRSRSFKTRAAIKKDFENAVTSTGTLYRATDKVRSGMSKRGDRADIQMLYDLMMNDLGSNYSGGDHRRQIDKLATREGAAEYITKLTSDITGISKESQQAFVDNITELLADNLRRIEIGNQASVNEVTRRTAGQNYVRNADAYNVDLSEFRDSPQENKRVIAERYGKGIKAPAGASIREETVSALRGGSGVDYTNRALFEIYRRLEEGINVFQVGRSKKLGHTPYPKFNQLKPPVDYNPKPAPKQQTESGGADIAGLTNGKYSEGPNLLQNQENEDGTTEQLTKGQRFSRWGKKRGKDLAGAMFSGSSEDVRSAFGAIISDVSQVAGDEMKKGMTKINNSFGNVTGWLKHKMFGTGYSYIDVDGKEKHVADNDGEDGGGLFGVVKRQVTSMFKGVGEKGKNWFSEVAGYFDYGDSYSKEDGEEEDPAIVKKRKRLIATSVGAFAGAGLLGGPMGLLVGALGANALGALGIDKKIKNFLFGHDEKGKPTGLVSKAADVIISPIQYQVGKTVAFAGSMLKKNVFGPLSDLGMAVKDRIHNHVASIFDDIKEKATAPFKKLGSLMMKGIAKAGVGLATIGHRVSTTLTGNAARLGIGAGSGAFGFMTNFTANRISTNSFHKLRSDEVYPLLVGQHYYDPSKDAGKKKDRSNIHVLTDDTPGVEDLREYNFKKRGIMLNGADTNCWMPRTKDYMKWRRKQRNKSIDDEMVASGYRKKGGIGGFFGGDYKAWHEAKWGSRQKFRDDARNAMSEREMSAEEVAAKIASEEEKTRAIQKEQLEVQQKTEQHISGIDDARKGPDCIFTHDQGIRDKLDTIIELMTGKKKGPKKKDASQEALANDAYANSMIGATSTLLATGDNVNKDETRIGTAIIDEASKDNSNRSAITQKYKELMAIQKDEKEGAVIKEEKKESLFEKLVSGLGSGLSSLLPMLAKFGAILAALWALFQNGGLSELLDRLGFGAKKFSETLDPNAEENPTTIGMNTVTSLADAQVKNAYDWANPLAKVYHNARDGAGERIVNSTMTDAKNAPFKWALTKDVLGSTWGTIKQGVNAEKATRLGAMADQYRMDGAEFRADFTDARAARAQAASEQGAKEAAAPKTNAVSTLARNMARIGVIDVTGRAAGWGAETIAKGFGVSDEHAATAGRVTNAAVSGGLTVNMAKAAVTPGKKAWVDKIIDGVTKFIKWFAEKIGADKAIQKIGSSKVVSGITGMIGKVTGALKSKLDDVLISKVEAKLAALGVSNAAAVATAGLAIAAGAVAGAIDGYCKTEHLFQVMPGQATAGMKTISTLISSVMGAASMTPIGWICVIFDVIDAVLTAFPGIEKGLTQMLAQKIYEFFGGGAELAEKQAAMEADRQHLKEVYGVEMNAATHNDEVNSTGALNRIWSGKAQVGEDGFVVRDDAGAVLKKGGMKSWFVGGEREYEKDENGKVIRDEKGAAVQAVDAYGRGIKKDAKWGDAVGNFFSDGARFFTGGKKYKTDENGRAIRDENGELVVESEEKNIFGKAGDAWNAGTKFVGDQAKKAGAAISKGASDLWEGAKDLGKSAASWLSSINPLAKKEDKKKLEDEVADEVEKESGDKKKKKRRTSGTGSSKLGAVLAESVGAAASGIAGLLTNPLKTVKDGLDKMEKNGVETDEDGKPLKDENGKVVKKKGLSGLISGAIGGIRQAATGIVSQITSSISDAEKEQFETDAEGKPINVGMDTTGKIVNGNAGNIKKGNIGAVFSTGLGRIRAMIMDPLNEMTDGANKFEKQQAPWKKDGAKSLGEWVSKRIGSFWNWFTGSVDEATGNSSTSSANRLTTRAGTVSTSVGSATSRLLSNMFPNSRNRTTSGIGGPDLPVGGPITPDDIWDRGSNYQGVGAVKSGGNPLNKPYQVTSPFGPRQYPHSGQHNGVDLCPVGEQVADVGARFSGTIAAVKTDVADSDHAYADSSGTYHYNGNNSMGNYVNIRTDDGMLIRNMHLKAGSIPSSIKVGSRVNIGDKIGEMGTTGWSTGKHLHYQIESPEGKPIDPMPSVKGGDTMSSFNSDGSYYDANGATLSDESTEKGKSQGILAGVLNALKALGSKFLSWITGGLYGEESADASISDSAVDDSYYTDGIDLSSVNIPGIKDPLAVAKVLDLNKPVELLTNAEVCKIPGIKACKCTVVDLGTGITYDIFWGGPPSNYYHTDYSCYTPADTDKKIAAATVDGGKYPSWTPRPCVLQIAGRQLAVGTHNFNHSVIIGGNPGPKNPNSPYHTMPEGGWPPGGHYCMYYKDSSSGSGKLSQNAKEHQEAAQAAYEMANQIIAAAKAASKASGVGEGEAELWKYFRSLGYSDKAIAGVLGCWNKESSSSAKRVEWDYGNAFKQLGYDGIANDREGTDAFTRKLFQVYANQGLGINRDAYGGGDGHLYPGIGYAQWTGPRAKQLLDFAKKNGLTWYKPATQLAFLDQEFKGSHKGTLEAIEAASSPGNAAHVFCRKYEHGSIDTTTRQAEANRLYRLYAGKYPGPSGGSDIRFPGGVAGCQDDSCIQDNYNMAVGGPRSSISGRNFNRTTLPVGGPTQTPRTLSPVTSSYSNIPKSISPRQGAAGSQGGGVGGPGSNLDPVINIMKQMLTALESIRASGETSSDLLGELNGKEFVDQNLRDTLNAMGKVSKKGMQRHASSGSASTAVAMARP